MARAILLPFDKVIDEALPGTGDCLGIEITERGIGDDTTRPIIYGAELLP